jgi:hypothetical protein
MHSQTQHSCSNSHEQFRLRFKDRFRQLTARRCPAAEAFGPAWEMTVIEVPLPDIDQAAVYWDLIGWAKSYELFTTRRSSVQRATPLLAH